jgi:chromate transporter
MNNTLLALVRVFVPLSLVSFGGARTIIPDIERQAVAVHGWLTHREFIELFAISRAAPGPGVTLVTLIGWKAGGWLGALVASLAIYVPVALIVVTVAVLFRRYSIPPWSERIERALTPIAIGLILAGVFSVLDIMGGTLIAYAVTGASAAIMFWRRISPLLLLAGGGAVYAIAFLLT